MRKFRTFLFLFVILCIAVSCGGCSLFGDEENAVDIENVKVPEDFTFSITWDVYGISSYNSADGKLVKTWDATHPEDYITTLTFSEEELREIYVKLTQDINLYHYSNNYDPSGGILSTPTQTIIISMTANGKSKTVSCKDIAICTESDCKNQKAKDFLRGKNEIVSMIKDTEEWLSLPDYEFGYD